MGILLQLTTHWIVALVLLLAGAATAVIASARLLLAARLDPDGETGAEAEPDAAGSSRSRPEMRRRGSGRVFEALGDLDEEPLAGPAASVQPAGPAPEPESRPERGSLKPAADSPLPPEPAAAPAPAALPAPGGDVPILKMKARVQAAADPAAVDREPEPPAAGRAPAASAAPAPAPAASAAPPAAAPARPAPAAGPEARGTRPTRPQEPSAAVSTRPETPARVAAPRPEAPTRRSEPATRPPTARTAPAPARHAPDFSRSSRFQPPQDTPRPPERANYTVRILARELRQSFRGAFQYLASHTEPDGTSPSRPLYLLVGTPEAGKTTLLNQIALPWRWRQTQRTFGASSGMMWKFSESGLILEIPGSYLLDTGEGYTAWRRIAPLLQKYRPRRPADGLILMLPANLFLPGNAEAAAERESTLQTIREQFDHLAQAISMRLPVYVIVSKCDLLPGFAEFYHALPAHNRQQPFGWSNPGAPDQEFDSSQVADGLQEVRQGLLRLQAESAIEQPDPSQFSQQLRLADAFQHLTGRLNAAILTLMSSSRASSCRILRGIYFCGDPGPAPSLTTDEPPVEKSIHHSAKRRFAARATRQIAFLQLLVPKRIFPEWGLATPTGHPLAVRHPLARSLQLTALVLALVLASASTYAWKSLSRIRDQQVLPLLQLVRNANPSVPPATRLSNLADLARNPLRSWLLPASLLPGVQNRIQQTLIETLQQSLFPQLTADLQAQGHALADKWAVVASNPGTAHPTAALTSPDQLAEFRSLRRFTLDWEHLQNEIDLYQNLAKPEHSTTPEELDRFLHEMGVPVVPLLPPEAPMIEALAKAQGKTYQYPPVDAKRASQEMQNMVRHLLYRWYLDNALIDDLQALGKLPSDPGQDIRRSQLAARVRMDLTNVRLSSTLQTDRRLDGPLYAVTLGAVHRSGYMSPDLRDFIQNETEADIQQVQSILQQLHSPLGHPLVQQQGSHWQLAPELQ